MFECDMPGRIKTLEKLVADRNKTILHLDNVMTHICITRAKREEWVGKKLNRITELEAALQNQKSMRQEYLKHCSRCKRKYGII